jgi:hypothetical protein
MQTDNICPSIDGPLCSVKKMAQSGKFGPGVGGKARVHGHMLATKGSDGQTGNVPVRTIPSQWKADFGHATAITAQTRPELFVP